MLAPRCGCRPRPERVLAGKATTVAAAMRRKAPYHGLAPPARANANVAPTYLANKAPHLDYPRALEAGWPIATGLTEGACRHPVKDRMDIPGHDGASKDPKQYSNCGPSTATATSRSTGATTYPRNDGEITRSATPTTLSRRRPEVPSEEPHPFRIPTPG